MPTRVDGGISILEYHVLLALANEPLYGYAISTAVEEESDGVLSPRAGTLYRVLARLLAWGVVCEEAERDGGESHPGRPRRWYALTAEGRHVLAAESRRLRQVSALAERRLRASQP